MIISLVDMLAIAILLTHKRVKGAPPFLLVTGFYLFAIDLGIASGLMMVMRREKQQRMRAARTAKTAMERPAPQPVAQT